MEGSHRSAQDATLINVHALKTRIAKVEVRVKSLESSTKAAAKAAKHSWWAIWS